MNITPARNAIKHGLSSLRHMPKGREAELEPIEHDLIESRLPETPEQLEIVHELAFAMWQKGEHERVTLHESEKLAEKAGDLFDQKALEDFQKLHRLWLEDPMKQTRSMISTKLGVEHFVEIWQVIENCLNDGHGITLQMGLNAVRTEGCSPSPHFIFGAGSWLMSRTMACRTDHEEFAQEWLEKVDAHASFDAMCRISSIMTNIPQPQESYNQLRERADLRLNHWTSLFHDLSSEYDVKRQEFIRQYSVNVMSSEEFENQLKRLHRYRVFTENRIKELNRRLAKIKSEMLKKERLQDEREFRKQNHEIAVAQMQPHQFGQLLEYRKHQSTEPKTENPKPPQNANLIDEAIDRIPPDWQNHTEALANAIPNAAIFSLWTNEQLVDSSHLIKYLIQLPSTNKHWIEQIKACQEYELQLRSLTDCIRE